MPGADAMTRLREAVEQEAIHPIVQNVFDLDAAADAHRDAESGQGTFGKSVIRVAAASDD